jgi:hypothetical protein
MPVGSVGKWLVLGTLVATLGAGGCKEDNGDDTPTDSGTGGGADTGTGGGTDSGAADAGPKDSGAAADATMEAAVAVMCGTPPVACTGHTTGLGPVAPGCAHNYQDAEVCGISSATILMGAEPKFLEKNAPGVASTSCAMFYDSRETAPDGGVPDGGMATMGNGLIDTVLMVSGLTISLQYPGCCTKAGFCSGDGKLGKASLAGGAYNDSDNGYGCMESSIFFRSLPVQAQKIPCDPVSGVITQSASGDAGADAGASDAGADGGNS